MKCFQETILFALIVCFIPRCLGYIETATPASIDKSCEIPIIENGVVTVISSGYNQPESTTIKIECVDERYRPFPPNLGPIFVCTNGKWDKEIPVCGYIVPNRQG